MRQRGGAGRRDSESTLNEPQLHRSHVNCLATTVAKIVQLNESSMQTVNWEDKSHN